MRRVGSLWALPTNLHTTFRVSCSLLHDLFDAVQFQPQKIIFPRRWIRDTSRRNTECGVLYRLPVKLKLIVKEIFENGNWSRTWASERGQRHGRN